MAMWGDARGCACTDNGAAIRNGYNGAEHQRQQRWGNSGSSNGATEAAAMGQQRQRWESRDGGDDGNHPYSDCIHPLLSPLTPPRRLPPLAPVHSTGYRPQTHQTIVDGDNGEFEEAVCHLSRGACTQKNKPSMGGVTRVQNWSCAHFGDNSCTVYGSYTRYQAPSISIM